MVSGLPQLKPPWQQWLNNLGMAEPWIQDGDPSWALHFQWVPYWSDSRGTFQKKLFWKVFSHYHAFRIALVTNLSSPILRIPLPSILMIPLYETKNNSYLQEQTAGRVSLPSSHDGGSGGRIEHVVAPSLLVQTLKACSKSGASSKAWIKIVPSLWSRSSTLWLNLETSFSNSWRDITKT